MGTGGADHAAGIDTDRVAHRRGNRAQAVRPPGAQIDRRADSPLGHADQTLDDAAHVGEVARARRRAEDAQRAAGARVVQPTSHGHVGALTLAGDREGSRHREQTAV